MTSIAVVLLYFLVWLEVDELKKRIKKLENQSQ